MIRIISMALAAVALAGCATAPPEPPKIAPICSALIGPIHYNSHNRNSLRYAGPKLAPDLAIRNHVGINLHCPAYK